MFLMVLLSVRCTVLYFVKITVSGLYFAGYQFSWFSWRVRSMNSSTNEMVIFCMNKERKYYGHEFWTPRIFNPRKLVPTKIKSSTICFYWFWWFCRSHRSLYLRRSEGWKTIILTSFCRLHYRKRSPLFLVFSWRRRKEKIKILFFLPSQRNYKEMKWHKRLDIYSLLLQFPPMTCLLSSKKPAGQRQVPSEAHCIPAMHNCMLPQRWPKTCSTEKKIWKSISITINI